MAPQQPPHSTRAGSHSSALLLGHGDPFGAGRSPRAQPRPRGSLSPVPSPSGGGGHRETPLGHGASSSGLRVSGAALEALLWGQIPRPQALPILRRRLRYCCRGCAARGKSGQPPSLPSPHPAAPKSPPFPHQHPFDTQEESSNPISPGLPCLKTTKERKKKKKITATPSSQPARASHPKSHRLALGGSRSSPRGRGRCGGTTLSPGGFVPQGLRNRGRAVPPPCSALNFY